MVGIEATKTNMVTVEGGDGTFKTDTGRMAMQVLEGFGVTIVEYERIPGLQVPDFPKDKPILLYLREPGGSVPGVDIRRILLENNYSADLFPPAYPMGYFFDRGISIGMLAEFMNAYPNAIVFQDRCHWTTLTMQMYDAMRRGKVDLDVTHDALMMIDSGFWMLVKQQLGEGFPYPGHVLAFDASVDEVMVRTAMAKSTLDNWRDRDTRRGKEFIRQKYLQLIQLHPQDSRAINTHFPPEKLLSDVVASILSVLPPQILAQLDLSNAEGVIDRVLRAYNMDGKWALYQAQRAIKDLIPIEDTIKDVYATWSEYGIGASGYVEP